MRAAAQLIRSSRIASRRLPTYGGYGVRALATDVASSSSSIPPPPPVATSNDPVLNRIVDDISGLSLLQAADLVTLLKTRLNIQEIAMPSGPAPVAAAPAEDAAPAEETKPKEKTVFNVTLEKFDATAKPKIIKEIKNLIPNMNLMEAKKFAESVPKVLKENIPKEDAEKLQKTLEALGATVTLS